MINVKSNKEFNAPKSPNMSRRTFTKAAGVSAAALALAGTGGALAWFTGRDEKANRLSVSDNLNVQVVEPAWNPEAAGNVVPGQHIPKDPRIRNLHDAIPGYLFVEIRVPTAVVAIYDEATSAVLPAAKTPLFSYEANTEWTLLQEFEDGDEIVRRYGWPKPIEAQGQTPPIFEEVVFANLAEVQGQEGAKRLTVTAYGIQSHGFSNCQDAWTAYKLQNGIGDGTPGTVSAVVVGTAAGNKLQFVQGEPSVGDELDGGEVLSVVPDVEKLPSGEKSPLVSDEHRDTIVEVEDTVPTKPENTVNWFKDMENVKEIDLSGLDTSEVTDKTGMFKGTPSLELIKVGENTDIAEAVPDCFELSDDDGCQRVWHDTGKISFLRPFETSDEGRFPSFSIDNRFSKVTHVGFGNLKVAFKDGREIVIPGKDDISPIYSIQDAITLPLQASELPSNTEIEGYYWNLRFYAGDTGDPLFTKTVALNGYVAIGDTTDGVNGPLMYEDIFRYAINQNVADNPILEISPEYGVYYEYKLNGETQHERVVYREGLEITGLYNEYVQAEDIDADLPGMLYLNSGYMTEKERVVPSESTSRYDTIYPPRKTKETVYVFSGEQSNELQYWISTGATTLTGLLIVPALTITGGPLGQVVTSNNASGSLKA